MTAYVTTDELRHWIGIENTSADAVLVPIVSSAKLWVDSRCGRRFDEDSTSSARYYYPEDPYHVVIDDAVSISAVATDDGDDGTYSTTWASTDYQKCPVNGAGQNGAGGWPYTDLLAIEARTFPANARPSLKVTAVWGWSWPPVKSSANYSTRGSPFTKNTPISPSTAPAAPTRRSSRKSYAA